MTRLSDLIEQGYASDLVAGQAHEVFQESRDGRAYVCPLGAAIVACTGQLPYDAHISSVPRAVYALRDFGVESLDQTIDYNGEPKWLAWLVVDLNDVPKLQWGAIVKELRSRGL